MAIINSFPDGVDKTYVDNKVKTDVPANAKFTDTITSINGKTGAIAKADIVALGIPAQDRRTARFTVGTSAAGWTAADVDYLCDGTNDATQIIAALNALPDTGGEVVILDGTYNITESINIPYDNVVLRGNGNATILKRMYNSTSSDSGATARGLITLNSKSGCKIVDLQIDGNKGSYTSVNNYGIRLHSSSNNTITGNTCNNNNNGIYLYSSSNNTITGNTCNNNNYYGIYLNSSSNNTITGNTCNNNNYYGIHLNSSSNENTITGNTCNNNDRGIYLNASSNNNTITSNTCNSNNSYGINLSSSSNNTITGNTCNNNNYSIYLNSSNNNYNCIVGNNLSGNTTGYQSGGGTGNLEESNVK